MSDGFGRLTSGACTLWMTGLSGSGKSTLAQALLAEFQRRGVAVCILDGDVVRAGLCVDLGFSDPDRRENSRRIAEVSKILNSIGVIAIVSLISPFAEGRAQAREIIGEPRFIEVYMSAQLEVCEGRDVKGLYAKARRAEILEFTGVSAPYEPPEAPAVEIDSSSMTLAESLQSVLRILECAGRV